MWYNRGLFSRHSKAGSSSSGTAELFKVSHSGSETVLHFSLHFQSGVVSLSWVREVELEVTCVNCVTIWQL